MLTLILPPYSPVESLHERIGSAANPDDSQLPLTRGPTKVSSQFPPTTAPLLPNTGPRQRRSITTAHISKTSIRVNPKPTCEPEVDRTPLHHSDPQLASAAKTRTIQENSALLGTPELNHPPFWAVTPVWTHPDPAALAISTPPFRRTMTPLTHQNLDQVGYQESPEESSIRTNKNQ